MHQIVRIDFENYNSFPLLRGHIPLRHPLSPQMPMICQSLIWASPLFKNAGSTPDLYPTLRMDVTSKHISSEATLKDPGCCRFLQKEKVDALLDLEMRCDNHARSQNEIQFRLTCFKGYCTSYPKISMFYVLFQNYQHLLEKCASYSKLPKDLENVIEILVGHADFMLWIKTVKMLFG